MGFYDRFILPHCIELVCGLKPIRRQRAKLVPLASGTVLEIGFGSGLNLPYYEASAVGKVWALEPSEEMSALARKKLAASRVKVELINASAEEIPLPAQSVDTVLVTYTLCTLPDVAAALAEARRVLKGGGRLLFCEHGAAPDEGVRRWQDRIDPLWTRLAGGCHLNRAIPSLIEAGGFHIDHLDTMYLPGWKPATFNYWGTAVPR